MEDNKHLEAIEEYYNSHYIWTDDRNRIIAGWSDAFQHPQDGDICINSEGGYQFRIGGEENPRLFDEWGVPLYMWDGEAVQRRSEQEIEADRPEPEPPKLSDTEVLLLAVAELAEKTGVVLDAMPEPALERLGEITASAATRAVAVEEVAVARKAAEDAARSVEERQKN